MDYKKNTLRKINIILKQFNNFSNMTNIKLRRDSMASMYRRTTKFIASNTNLMKTKLPQIKRQRNSPKALEEIENPDKLIRPERFVDDDEEENFGERDLDYYLGVRKHETYWRDPEREEQLRKDYLINHCGISETDYENLYKKKVPEPTIKITPKLKQVPFKIHRKKRSLGQMDDLIMWSEKTGNNILRIFMPNKRDSESTSDSYSDCDSPNESYFYNEGNNYQEALKHFPNMFTELHIDVTMILEVRNITLGLNLEYI